MGKKKQLDTSLRLVFHNNNKILLIGHPSDFLKYLQTLKIADQDYNAIKNTVAAGLRDSLMV